MSKDTEGWFLLEVGCAECGDMPLALPRGTYSTEDEARAAADVGRSQWIKHPAGGVFAQWGSGGFWAAPLGSLEQTGGQFGSEYDEAYR